MTLTKATVIQVTSTLLASVAYDKVGLLLELEFRDGAIHQYSAVPETVYQELIVAESKGVYFNRHIRDHFSHRRVRPPNAKELLQNSRKET
jgi:hypothetical protein